MNIKQVAKLFNAYHKQLYISAVAITKNREAAEDAVHDALIAVAETKSDVRHLKAYLFSSVRNKALYVYAKQKISQVNSEDILLFDEDTTQQQVFASQVFKYLEKLNQEQQQTIIMKVFGGLTFKEISIATNQSPNTVASWYRRGLNTLKEKINEQ